MLWFKKPCLSTKNSVSGQFSYSFSCVITRFSSKTRMIHYHSYNIRQKRQKFLNIRALKGRGNIFIKTKKNRFITGTVPFKLSSWAPFLEQDEEKKLQKIRKTKKKNLISLCFWNTYGLESLARAFELKKLFVLLIEHPEKIVCICHWLHVRVRLWNRKIR